MALSRKHVKFLLRRAIEKTRAGLPILFLFTFIVIIDVLFLYILDQKFKADKKELISTTWKYRSINNDFMNDVSKALEEMTRLSPLWDKTHDSRAVIRSATEAELEIWAQRLRNLIQNPRSITAAEHPIYVAKIYPIPEEGETGFENAVLQVSDLLKYDRLNNFENSFLTTSFSGFIESTHSFFEAEYAYTNPPNSPEIAAMAWQYRIYGALFVVFSIFVFFIMLRNVLLPIHRVAVSLEFMQRRQVETIPGGSTRVERAYNALARNTQLLEIGRKLESNVGLQARDDEPVDPWVRIGRHAPGIIRGVIPFDMVAVFSADTSGRPVHLIGYEGEDPPDDLPVEQFREAARNRETLYSSTLSAWLAPIRFNEEVHGFLVVKDPEGASAGRRLCEGVASQIENVLLRLAQQQIVLDREKNEISINLCTNMGHDLTNVIATSKWDIDTIRRALEEQLLTMKEERLAPLLTGSVEGLLNNTRFLQEIVEIYRAFGYTKRPEYSATDVGSLIREVISLFELSTTRDYRFEAETPDDLPRVHLEPRLMKLALFNLLTNASQAITRRKLGEKGESEPGVIRLVAEMEMDELVIRVQDNGVGFRYPNGELMNPQDIQRVFAYGFSTKDEKQGGTGIGLSWVRTIVEEYHSGRVVPLNRPEGGAEMRVEIPLNGAG